MHSFNIECLVYQRPNLRTYSIEMESYIGTDVLRSVFDSFTPRPEVKSLFLSFPERWLNVIEQRELFNRLEKYCQNLENLQMKTHSVYFLQVLPRECIKIVRAVDDEELPSEKTEDALFIKNAFDLFNEHGLTIIG